METLTLSGGIILRERIELCKAAYLKAMRPLGPLVTLASDIKEMPETLVYYKLMLDNANGSSLDEGQ